jgi:ubiquinone/menaquinone biosynthesis C-methylase UbiE
MTQLAADRALPQERDHRWFAFIYDRLLGYTESRLGALIRPRLMGEAHGRVLEFGAGTGASFPYYPSDAYVTATEPDPHMLARARRRVMELGRDGIELRQALVEQLPFADASFDHVVTSLVLCYVHDQPSALEEVRRVLKPGGSLRFFEHVRNDGVVGAVQDAITPVWRWLLAGCHPNRRTRAAIEDAGFAIDWIETVWMGPGIPAVYGVARPV